MVSGSEIKIELSSGGRESCTILRDLILSPPTLSIMLNSLRQLVTHPFVPSDYCIKASIEEDLISLCMLAWGCTESQKHWALISDDIGLINNLHKPSFCNTKCCWHPSPDRVLALPTAGLLLPKRRVQRGNEASSVQVVEWSEPQTLFFWCLSKIPRHAFFHANKVGYVINQSGHDKGKRNLKVCL